MATNRITREMEDREFSERPKQWMPPELLPEPDKMPGYAYRWIASTVMGVPNARNLSSKFREGWEPVPIEEQPKFALLVDPNSRFKDNIEIAGLLLCKMPVEFIQQRNDYYAKVTKDNMEAVDSNFMRENDPRMPLFAEKRSGVSFGKGTK